MRTPFALPKATRSIELRRTGGARTLGERGGAYEVVRRVGLGDRTEVLVAVGRGPFGLARPVTLKRPRPDLAEGALADATAALVREAHAYARLTHPAIVRLYDFVVDGGRPTLVMENVEGTSLRHLLASLTSRGERLDDASALYVGYRLFSALMAAHHARHPITAERAPVVHGDVCFETILVPWDGHVKLVDFGNAAVTRTEADDVRAACVVLRDLMLRSVHRTSPPGLAAALERGLHPDPRQRLLSAAEMASTLQRILDVEGARLLLVQHLARLARSVPRPAPPTRALEDVTPDEDDGDDSQPTSVSLPTSMVVPAGTAASSSGPSTGRSSAPPLPRPAMPPPPMSSSPVSSPPRVLTMLGRQGSPFESRSPSDVVILVVRVAVLAVTLAAAIVAAYLYLRAG